ncbi:DUF6064 family protein [Microbulbifer magnicolonia]|uniref:DUF6064 family protein n=1 Tax=Microbulbifer magnicolonia TaxID=3109744 RepID=UPI002B406F96|nr:DUF6064 family protein [Microbulbifer sp. GG15]
MSEWSSYRLQDFIPFTSDIYFRLLERMGEAYWPLHLLILALGASAFFLSLRGRARIACFLLAPVWGFVGVAYFFARYGELNWAGNYMGWAFLAQAATLTLFSITHFGTEVSPQRRGLPFFAGVLIAATGLLGYPVIAPLMGYSWFQAETFGIHPAPTAVTTLGLVVISLRGAAMWIAAAIPLLWITVSGLTLVVLDAPWASAPFAILALGLAGLVWAEMERRSDRAKARQAPDKRGLPNS